MAAGPAPHFEASNDLHWYEVAALIELGSRDAAKLYFKFVSAVANCGKTTHELMNPKDDAKDDQRIWSALCIELRARRQELSQEFEDGVVAILDSDNDVEKSVSRSLTDRFPSSRLLRLAFERMTPGRRSRAAFGQLGDILGHVFDFDAWLGFWTAYPVPVVRNILIAAARHLRDPRLEQLLRQCLNDNDLRDAAATSLAELGCYGASPEIRSSLAAASAAPQDEWHAQVAPLSLVHALRCLRDPAAVELLAEVARSNSYGAFEALAALGDIQTVEAGRALIDIATDDAGKYTIPALIHHGFPKCVEFAVGLARQRADGIHWLLKEGLRNIFFREWSRGKFHNHIATAPIIAFVEGHATEINDEDLEELFHWIRNVDDEPVRALLRRLAASGGNQLFPLINSSKWSLAAKQALADRGDESVVKIAAEQIMRDEWFGHRYIEDDLENFHAPSLVRELIACLGKAASSIEIRRLIRQIGRLGTADDSTPILHFAQSEDGAIANVASEAVARLTDPRLIPDNWP